MKILFDHQIFDSQEFGGASRMFTDLIRRLRARGRVEASVALKWSNNEYGRDIAGRPGSKFPMESGFKIINRLRNWDNKRNSRQKLQRWEFDLFHPTYYDTYFLEILRGRPFVITIFDMIHEKWPELFSHAASTSREKKVLAQRASRIVTISNQSKTDIVNFFHVEPDRIDVVYPTTSIGVDNPSVHPSGGPEKSILYVGTRAIYKNFERFLRATQRVLANDPQLTILCVGGGPFTSNEKELIGALRLRQRIRQASLADDELVETYRRSLVFVFPSLYEGFGIPILEAFTCGCPVILSNAGAFPEVAGDAAVYFDPESIDSMVSAINTVIQDLKLRDELVRRGKLRLTLFDPENGAEQMESVYLKAF